MRCINIEFQGFKRLADTSCNTDGKMIAFLGPNEAGKSSVLQGLLWLSTADEPLPGRLRNRSATLDPELAVVRARFALADDDRALLQDLPSRGKPLTFVMARYPDGTLRTGLRPALTRDPSPFEDAREVLRRVAEDYAQELEADAAGIRDGDLTTAVSEWIDTVNQAFDDPEASWDDAHDEEFENLCEWLEALNKDDPTARALGRAAALERARDILRTSHPDGEARRRMIERAPEFALFSQEDRDLASSYDISDPNLRADPPRALANLLWIAGLDLDDLWNAIEEENTGLARTKERRANENLAAKLGPKWRQERIDVQLNVTGELLEVLVVETSDNGADTPIGERSDGLRMFVALVAFLARHDFATPPILLVDEAETHLHYDAQADLVEVLTNDVEATQVFYTTHSPGCLPRDLGTGVRLVAPVENRRDASELRNDFWTNERPGFTPLLFAMGAGAAAFSAFRRAVLTEGAADMILLPSLIRLATGLNDLPYQVAPGIANHHGSGLELEETAARVAYLLDGDAGGAEHRKRLVNLGIDDDRIFEFDEGKASEDYVHPDRYLDVVNALIASTGVEAIIDLTDLDPQPPISKAVKDWCKAHHVRPPGKPTVASVLIAEPTKLALADDASDQLKAIHGRLMSVLDTPPVSA